MTDQTPTDPDQPVDSNEPAEPAEPAEPTQPAGTVPEDAGPSAAGPSAAAPSAAAPSEEPSADPATGPATGPSADAGPAETTEPPPTASPAPSPTASPAPSLDAEDEAFLDAAVSAPEMPDFGASSESTDGASAFSFLGDVSLRVRVELGRTLMYVEDVLRLNEQSVVELDRAAGDPVDIFVNGRHVARGEVLVVNENFCVRVSEIIDRASLGAAGGTRGGGLRRAGGH